MAKLIYQDPDSGQEVSVEVGPEFPEVTIGRNPGNIVRVNNPSISRKHAKLVFDAGQITLYDLNSSNGSYVNGTRIQNQVLVDGDRVRVGEFPLDFVEVADAQPAQPAQPAEPEMLDVEPVEQPMGGTFDGGGSAFDRSNPSSGGFQEPSAASAGLEQATGAAEHVGAASPFGAEQADQSQPPESAAAQSRPPQPADQPSPQQDHGRFGRPDDAPEEDDYAEPVMLDDGDFEEVAEHAVADALSEADSASTVADSGPDYYDDDPDTVAQSGANVDEMFATAAEALHPQHGCHRHGCT